MIEWSSLRTGIRVLFVMAAAVFASPATGGSAVDLHWLWDDRCAMCHGHSGEFARKFLTVSGGQLQGRHHTDDLRQFMHNHYLAGNEVDAVYNMLLAQTSIPPRFRDECSACHGTAAIFVRNTLVLRDGILYGRDSAQAANDFLEHHRNLEPEDVNFFVQLLTRLAREIYRP